MRKSSILLLSPLLLLGCERPNHLAQYDRPAALRLSAPAFAPAPDIVVNANALFSYMHTLVLEMPRAGVEPRFERARERCLHDVTLACKLISSSLDKPEGENAAGYSAQLVVALPHDKITAYERGLVAPVGGTEAATITSSSTTAQNVTQDAATAGRKVAQLSDYRDRLLALLKRPNLSVDDLIKVEGELAKTQSDLDEALSQKTDVDDRVAREQMSISLTEKAGTANPLRPIVNVWKHSVQILSDSTADALEFLIAYIPWLPLTVGAIFLIRWLWRIARRRSPAARSAPE